MGTFGGIGAVESKKSGRCQSECRELGVKGRKS